VIKWTADTFECCSFCTYEQIRPDDPFGVVMLQNLEVQNTNIIFKWKKSSKTIGVHKSQRVVEVLSVTLPFRALLASIVSN
jgi:hypothetical protein